MDYIVNVTEANFSEVWQATQQIPVVFSFTSLQDVASIETDAMLRRLVDEYPKQFLLATVNCDEQRELAMQFRVQTFLQTVNLLIWRKVNSVSKSYVYV